MKRSLRAVVLAAGKSERMKSAHSKILHKILGKEIINHLLDSIIGSGINPEDITLVVGPDHGQIKEAVHPDIRFAVQEEPRGTAHALLAAGEQLAGFQGDLLVTVGDNPYITSNELIRLREKHRTTGAQCTLISAAFPDTPPPTAASSEIQIRKSLPSSKKRTPARNS